MAREESYYDHAALVKGTRDFHHVEVNVNSPGLVKCKKYPQATSSKIQKLFYHGSKSALEDEDDQSFSDGDEEPLSHLAKSALGDDALSASDDDDEPLSHLAKKLAAGPSSSKGIYSVGEWVGVDYDAKVCVGQIEKVEQGMLTINYMQTKWLNTFKWPEKGTLTLFSVTQY